MDSGHFTTACTSVTHRWTLAVLIDFHLESLGFEFRGSQLLSSLRRRFIVVAIPGRWLLACYDVL